MMPDRPFRRLPLRDMMTDAEKRIRDLGENLNSTWVPKVSDLRDLSRPVRRKSHYPTLLVLLNSLNKVGTATEETEQLLEVLTAELEEIRDHARRERLNR